MKEILILFILIVVYVTIIKIHKYYYNKKKRKLMKDLTGNYIHNKTPKGIVLKVQYVSNGVKKVRKATLYDIIVLTKYKYI